MKNLILITFLSIATSFGALVELKWDTGTKVLSRTDLKPTFASITNSAATVSTLAGYDANKALISIATLAALEAAIGGVNVLSSTELDTLAELETLLGGANVLVSTEIDSIAELETLLGSVNILLKTEIDTEAEFEALLFTLPEGGGGGSDANWDASGSTNSLLAGIAYVHQVQSTNGYISLGDGATAGWDLYEDADGSNHGRLTSPTDITSNWNFIWPSAPGASGVFKVSVSTTNVTGSWAALVTGDLPSGATLDEEWNTIAEIETATGVNILVSTEIDSIAELEALLGSVNILLKTEIDSQAEFEALLFTLPGAGSGDDVFIGGVDIVNPDFDDSATVDFSVASTNVTATVLGIQSGTADLALTVAGNLQLNETDEQFAFHSGSNGEISGEAALSGIYTRAWSFDPDAVCDGAVDRLFLMWTGDEAPEGIIIDEWKISFEADPTTEIDADLKYADAMIGVANPVTVDALDTTAGTATEDTDANINGGSVIPNGKALYIEFGTAYTESNHQIMFQVWYHYEED